MKGKLETVQHMPLKKHELNKQKFMAKKKTGLALCFRLR